MRTLGINVAAGAVTQSVRTTRSGEVYFDIRSATNAQAVTIEMSHDDVNFVQLRADSVLQSLTTNDIKVYSLPGGVYLRVAVDAGATDTVDVRVDGIGIDLD